MSDVSTASAAPAAPAAPAEAAPAAKLNAPSTAPIQKPAADPLPTMSPDELAALLKQAMSAAMAERDAALNAYNKAVPTSTQRALLQVQWVEDVRSWWKWASVRVGMVGVFLCGLIPATVDVWHSAPPQLKDFVANYLPSGGGAGMASALFALQVLARVLQFRPDATEGDSK